MATRSVPRVRVPAEAKVGEIIEIKTLISHEMESGHRKDPAGAVVPRRIIREFRASFERREFFVAAWHPAISANPYQSFFFRATSSGSFEFVWKDDDGSEYSFVSPLKVG